jgi:hypothetical protein
MNFEAKTIMHRTWQFDFFFDPSDCQLPTAVSGSNPAICIRKKTANKLRDAEANPQLVIYKWLINS